MPATRIRVVRWIMIVVGGWSRSIGGRVGMRVLGLEVGVWAKAVGRGGMVGDEAVARNRGSRE